ARYEAAHWNGAMEKNSLRGPPDRPHRLRLLRRGDGEPPERRQAPGGRDCRNGHKRSEKRLTPRPRRATSSFTLPPALDGQASPNAPPLPEDGAARRSTGTNPLRGPERTGHTNTSLAATQVAGCSHFSRGAGWGLERDEEAAPCGAGEAKGRGKGKGEV